MDWLKIGTATGHCSDRPQVEEAIQSIYRSSGEIPPDRFLWLESPLQGCCKAMEKFPHGLSFPNRIGQNLYWLVRMHTDWPNVPDNADIPNMIHCVIARLQDEIDCFLSRPFREKKNISIGLGYKKNISMRLGYSGGQHSVNLLGWGYALGDESLKEKLSPYLTIAQNVGWWWPYQDEVVITERPVELGMDDKGVVKNLLYSDGFGFSSRTL